MDRKPSISEASITQSTLVRAPAEEVYQALTTASGLDGWFTTGASVDARPGGSIRFRWERFGPEGVTLEDGGSVLEAVPNKRFVFRWQEHQDPPTTVEIDFEPRQDGTLVRLREHGYPDTPEGLAAMLDCAAGWGEALTLMKFYVEHGLTY